MKENRSFFEVYKRQILTFLAGGLAFLLLFGSISFLRLAFRPGFGMVGGGSGASQEALQLLGQDMNEIRSLLLLPPKEYPFFTGNPEESPIEAFDALMIQFVDELGAQEKVRKLYAKNQAEVERVYGVGVPRQDVLNMVEDGLRFDVKDGEGAVAVDLGLTSKGEFVGLLYRGALEFEDSKDFDSVQKAVADYLKNNWPQDKIHRATMVAKRDEFVTNYLNSPEMATLLQEMGLHYESESESQNDYRFLFLNGEESRAVELRLDKETGEFSVQSEDDFEPVSLDANLYAKLKEQWSKVDLRTDLERLLEQRKEEMKVLLEDRAFQATLEKAELKIGEMKETELRIEYPVFDLEGNLLRTFFIDKTTGEFSVENAGQSEPLAQALETLKSSDSKKKTLYSPILFLNTVA